MTPWKLAILSAVIGVLPLLIALLGGFIADRLGCEMNEGSVQPCLLWGRDISHHLYGMFMCGWFAMLTLPLGFAGVVAAGIWALVRRPG